MPPAPERRPPPARRCRLQAMAALNPAELRFWGVSSCHNRTIHFTCVPRCAVLCCAAPRCCVVLRRAPLLPEKVLPAGGAWSVLPVGAAHALPACACLTRRSTTNAGLLDYVTGRGGNMTGFPADTYSLMADHTGGGHGSRHAPHRLDQRCCTWRDGWPGRGDPSSHAPPLALHARGAASIPQNVTAFENTAGDRALTNEPFRWVGRSGCIPGWNGRTPGGARCAGAASSPANVARRRRRPYYAAPAAPAAPAVPQPAGRGGLEHSELGD